MTEDKVKYLKGDLIELAKKGVFDVIVHGCNCQRCMGGGIARQIAIQFPDVEKVDNSTKQNNLGNILISRNYDFVIVNAYTQEYPGFGVQVDYDAIKSCFKKIKKKFHGLRIGIPKIGAGLGGGDWNRIESIISNVMKNENITVVEYQLEDDS